MRKLYEPRLSLDFFVKAKSKTIQEYEFKYERASEILDANPILLKIVGKKLSYDGKLKIGREGYTVEQALRSITLMLF